MREPDLEPTLRTYEELADVFDRQDDARQRDSFLALAADAALGQGRGDLAERFRLRLLTLSPHHLLRPYESFQEAAQVPDIQVYLADLKEQFPPEVAEALLREQRERNQAEALAGNTPGGILSSKPGGESELRVYTLQEDSRSGGRTVGPPRRSPRVGPLPVVSPGRSESRSGNLSGLPSAPGNHEEDRVSSRKPAPLPDVWAAPGGWFSTLLFFLGLSFFLGLAGFTLLRPFIGIN